MAGPWTLRLSCRHKIWSMQVRLYWTSVYIWSCLSLCEFSTCCRKFVLVCILSDLVDTVDICVYALCVCTRLWYIIVKCMYYEYYCLAELSLIIMESDMLCLSEQCLSWEAMLLSLLQELSSPSGLSSALSSRVMLCCLKTCKQWLKLLTACCKPAHSVYIIARACPTVCLFFRYFVQ